MANFLLVHGTAHGAWCWRDLVPMLRDMGHEVSAIDLPGSGNDTTPVADVTLAGYGTAIVETLDEPTILVGHSSGGFAIAEAAELDPSNISQLVYLCAYVPRPGKSLVDIKKDAPSNLLKGALEMAEDGLSFRFKENRLQDTLYTDCPPNTIEFARAMLTWQALAPQVTPVSYTGRGAQVKPSYVLCKNDGTIPPEHQRMMAAGFAPEDVYEKPWGHCPFFSDPEGLAATLDEIARKG